MSSGGLTAAIEQLLDISDVPENEINPVPISIYYDSNDYSHISTQMDYIRQNSDHEPPCSPKKTHQPLAPQSPNQRSPRQRTFQRGRKADSNNSTRTIATHTSRKSIQFDSAGEQPLIENVSSPSHDNDGSPDYTYQIGLNCKFPINICYKINTCKL